MAPKLSDKERLEYLKGEREYVEEVLEDAEDCKWAYLALIEIALITSKVRGSRDEGEIEKVREWVQALKRLDPLRAGRWHDLEQTLSTGREASAK